MSFCLTGLSVLQAIAVSQTPTFQKYGSRLLPIPFPGCEHETFMSDAYWWCATGLVSTNLHHQSGTCKMGPDTDPDAVVDPELRVRGVRGLRVVDTSIMPVIPAGHTNSMAFMIGEKASDLIKKTWLGRWADVRRGFGFEESWLNRVAFFLFSFLLSAVNDTRPWFGQNHVF